jgi:cobalt/nickel transport system permease protein
MHIPDGFLSLPVWSAMDGAALPSVAYLARRAQRESGDRRIPLMGVMGAFVFAAQMINFPVGNGTSGHLVGGALLSFVLGPAPASIVMTAILVTQALIFQDGGILALGANIFNMAIAGVLAGYLPYALLRGSGAGVFLGGAFSVMVSAVLALSELMISGVPMPHLALAVSLGLFAVSALCEGAITLAVTRALGRMDRGFPRRPGGVRGRYVVALILAPAALAAIGVFITSAWPDGIETLVAKASPSFGRMSRLTAPMAEYKLRFLATPWLTKTAAALAGVILVYVLCLAAGRALSGSRAARGEEGA